MGAALRGSLASGDHAEFERLEDFTTRLTEDLREWTDDLHITVTPCEKLPDYCYENRLTGDPADNKATSDTSLWSGIK
jgi:hypothetical protein